MHRQRHNHALPARHDRRISRSKSSGRLWLVTEIYFATLNSLMNVLGRLSAILTIHIVRFRNMLEGCYWKLYSIARDWTRGTKLFHLIKEGGTLEPQPDCRPIRAANHPVCCF